MNLAILHFHLNRGGVTRVIENHLRAIDTTVTQPIRVAILYGGEMAGWTDDLPQQLTHLGVSLRVVSELRYDHDATTSPESLARSLHEALRSLDFSPADTVLHVHNHSLGKNLALPSALARLAIDGWRLLLQIHDFAEDFRPENYRRLGAAGGSSGSPALYPQASQIHYAVLNRRDHEVLAAAGIASDRLHRVPNPISESLDLPERAAARKSLERRFGIGPRKRFNLYPVRGIRRKNLGEMLLLSLVDQDGQKKPSIYGLALSPLNPLERPFYERWKRFAQELAAPAVFETGETSNGGLTFVENLAAADAAVTTSVAEGFGMTFLEPWLASLPLHGRNLPEITADFVAAGMTFPALYERLNVPLDWVGIDDFADAFRTAGETLLAAYGRPELPMRLWLDAFGRKVAGGVIDFGDLDEPLQERVLRRVAGDSVSRDELRLLNPRLGSPDDPKGIAANAACVREAFAPAAIGLHLTEIYGRLLATDPSDVSNLDSAGVILNRFLDLSRFRLIRGLAGLGDSDLVGKGVA